MDRNRLKEVHQTDLQESRVNEDFVEWLKTGLPWWLMAFAAVCLVFWGRGEWRKRTERHSQQAWVDYYGGALPATLMDVAAEYDDVGAIPVLARLQAAEQYVRAVQLGRPVGWTPPAPGVEAQADATLTADERAEAIAAAKRLYEEVAAEDDGSLATTLAVTRAHMGLAALAEIEDRLDDARAAYERAAARADAHYPMLADQARRRAASVDDHARPVDLPVQAALPGPVVTPPDQQPKPVRMQVEFAEFLDVPPDAS